MPQLKSSNWSTSTYQQCARLIHSQQSLLLSTLSDPKTPHASYAPFILSQETLYIFVSALAQHTSNLLNHPQASVLIMEPEEKAETIFARQRIQLQMKSHPISREEALWQSTLDTFESHFGEIIQTLRSLPDFHLFQLHPISGLYVKGFGQAYPLDHEQIKKVFSFKNQSVDSI
ncbi:MAG: HugZ family protein [Thiomicrospira sp.]|nr:MAG: HugZ family protein [Thiomicrospira sp.]